MATPVCSFFVKLSARHLCSLHFQPTTSGSLVLSLRTAEVKPQWTNTFQTPAYVTFASITWAKMSPDEARMQNLGKYISSFDGKLPKPNCRGVCIRDCEYV